MCFEKDNVASGVQSNNKTLSIIINSEPLLVGGLIMIIYFRYTVCIVDNRYGEVGKMMDKGL